MKIKKVAIIVISVGLMLGASTGWASDVYPNKPIQLICPFAPGGDSDLSARVVADKLQEILGQPVVTVNKPGGRFRPGDQFRHWIEV